MGFSSLNDEYDLVIIFQYISIRSVDSSDG